jgi:hypothetical protein
LVAVEQAAHTLAVVAAEVQCISTNFLSLLLGSHMPSLLVLVVRPFPSRVFLIAMVGMDMLRRLKTLAGPVAAQAVVEIQPILSAVTNVFRPTRTIILLHVVLVAVLRRRLRAGR